MPKYIFDLFKIKDYLAIGVSLLALVLTACTFYFNIVRVEEFVVFVDDVEPVPYVKDHLLVLDKNDLGRIVFVNSGNRPVVVSRIDLFYIQPRENEPVICSDNGGINIMTDLSTTVVKANDVFLGNYKIKGAARYFEDSVSAKVNINGDWVFQPEGFNQNKEHIKVDICINIFFFTPSTRMQAKVFPVMRVEAGPTGWFYGDDEGPLQKQPAYLVKKSSTIYDGGP